MAQRTGSRKSIDVITSNIGFASLRYTGVDGMMGINEAHRVLKKGGHVFAIENAWIDRKALKEVFRLWGKDYYYIEERMGMCAASARFLRMLWSVNE